MKILREDAKEIAWCQSGVNVERIAGFPLEVVENRAYDSGRWMEYVELVVKDGDGNLWRATYERGLTENQHVDPFEDDGPEVEFKPVTRKVVESYEYEDVR